jgi:hypothetical protein
LLLFPPFHPFRLSPIGPKAKRGGIGSTKFEIRNFSDNEIEELMAPVQRKMVIKVLIDHVKSLRCLLYPQNLDPNLPTIQAYNDSNNYECNLCVIHNSPNRRDHHTYTFLSTQSINSSTLKGNTHGLRQKSDEEIIVPNEEQPWKNTRVLLNAIINKKQC